MESITPIQPTCTVSGALSFVLHVSRIAGIAPISFDKVAGGWRVRLSWFFYAYCMVLEITFHSFISFAIYDTRDDIVDGYEPSSNTRFMRTVVVVIGTTQIIVGILIGLTGYYRLSSVIDCTAHLEHINKEFDYLSIAPTASEFKTWIKLILMLLHGYIGSFSDYGIYMYDVIAANDKVPFTSLTMTFTYFNLVHLQLLSIQFHLVVMNLVYSQKRLNNHLRTTLTAYKKQSSTSTTMSAWSTPKRVMYIEEFLVVMPTNVASRSDGSTPSTASDESKPSSEHVRQLINIYCLFCDIIKKLNDGHGIPLIMLLLYCAVYLITSPYFVVTALIRSRSEIPLLKNIAIFAYCSLCYAMIITSTEPCHQSHIQLKITKILINQIIRFVPREPSDVHYQFKLFRRHIFLNPVSFSPMHLLKFNRNLSVAVVSAIITYLTVFINL